MEISFSKTLVKSAALIVPLFHEAKTFGTTTNLLSASAKRLMKSHLDSDYFKANKGEMLVLHPEKELFKHIILLGRGKEKETSEDDLRKGIGNAIKTVKKLKGTSVNIILVNESDTQAVGEGAILADYNFDKYITDKKMLGTKIETVKIIHPKFTAAMEKDLEKAQQIGENVMYVRDLVNTPAADMYPEKLSQEALKVAKLSRHIKVTIYDRKKLQKMGMGLLLGVGQGSKREPNLIVMEYKNKPKNKKPIAIVGKGITFDTGGLNIKPTGYIEDMKMDKSGAATVIGLFKIMAKLQPNLHVIGIAPCAENNVTEYATKPGDIHTSYAGKTVEITNTDAEGRLVLGDALAYVVKNYQPEAIVNLATLTGAVIYALGYDITGVLTTEQKLADKVIKAGNHVGEKMWQLPMDDELEGKVKGTVSDLQNSTKSVRADTIMGGLFLKQFTGTTPFVHLDIAGTAWSKEDKEYFAVGGTGVGLRTVWKFLEDYFG